MKRILAIIITISMLLMLALPITGFARTEQKVNLTDAIEIAKKTLNISTDNYNFNYNYNENRDGRSSWDLNWSAKNNTGGSISASVDSQTGDILNFYSWQSNEGSNTSRIPRYSKDQALEESKKFIEKVQPSKFKEMDLKESTISQYDMPIYSDTYSFNFVRQLNGLDFADNGVSITVDKNTLKVRSYTFNWDNGSFTDPSNAISLDEAKKIFKEKLGIELSYNIIYDQKSKTESAILVYSLKNGSNPIDAVTGKVLNNSWGPRFGMTAEKSANIAMDKASLTPEEQKSVDASSKYVSKEKALEEAEKYIILDANAKLSNSSLYVSSYDNSANWNFSWDSNDTINKIYSYMSAQIDANSCKIRSFSMGGSNFYPQKDTLVSYTKGQAQQIAEKFINNLEPDKFKLTKVVEPQDSYSPASDKINDYSFYYTANINGASCPFDSFNISINAYSGKVMSYGINWKDNISLPSTDKAMKLDDAYNALYNKAKLNLKYIKFYDYGNASNPSPQIKLAYVLDDFSGIFDANTGTFLDYNGQPIKDKSNGSFTDIKGNAAENDISILNDLGIIDAQGGKFNPNSVVRQKDFIKILVKTLAPNYVTYTTSQDTSSEEYDSYYETAIQKNIITKEQKKPDGLVTRQDAAKMIIKAMGIGYIAELGNIYSLSFGDAKLIPNNYKGYAAVAVGLKIIRPINGMFTGYKVITRGETATLIVNYLKVDTSAK